MTHLITGNQINLLRNGTQYFPALEDAIDNAIYEIHLQTYIYQNDETGLRIGDALKRAAQRDVLVYLLLDGFGSKDLPDTYLRELEASGVEVLIFRPRISPWTLKRSRLRRMHRKLVVVDGDCAFVGGINIIDDYDTPHQKGPRIDYAVQVQGPLLRPIHASAAALWQRLCRVYLRQTRPSVLAERTIEVAGNMRAAYVVRDNLLHRNDIEQAYLTAIAGAKSEIVIANAYFLPGVRFRRALRSASRRGVRVVVLLQDRVEYRILDFATHALYSSFLHAGIEIYEYHKSFMHSKVAVIDQRWVTVGSSNIDPFSLLLAREANIVVDDASFATDLRTDILRFIEAGARLVTAKEWEQGHLFKRFVSWLAFGLVRTMMGLAGYSDKD